MTATTFSYTGSPQSYVVPSGVTAVFVECWGAGTATGVTPVSLGGYSSGYLAVTAGETLNVYVGGSSVAALVGVVSAGGWNGGGDGVGSLGYGGNGGSDIRQGGTALANRVIVGGGAGTGGGVYGHGGGFAGNGPEALNGGYAHAGTQSAGGAGSVYGYGGNGGLGVGGSVSASSPWVTGGGGAGYYGGGSGSLDGSGTSGYPGGAGGSSYVGSLASGITTTGVRASHGQVIITQLAPNAPSLISPATNQVLQGSVTQRFQWAFSSAITSDSQSGFDLRYRVVSTSTWTTINGTTTNPFVDIAGGTISTPADYEWQVRTYETQGQVGPYSGSGFFTIATPTAAPTITAPTSGATIAIATATLTWSTAAAQASYQVRKVADGTAGAPDTATVIYDSNEVVSTTLRAHPLTFATNNVYEHLEVRIKVAGLWSPWADVRVLVSFTQPAAPVILLAPNNGAVGPPCIPPQIAVTAFQPAPVSGQPAVVSIDIYRSDDGVTTYRIAKSLAPSVTFIDYTPASGINYAYRVRAFAANGVYADSALTSALISVNPSTFGGFNNAY